MDDRRGVLDVECSTWPLGAATLVHRSWGEASFRSGRDPGEPTARISRGLPDQQQRRMWPRSQVGGEAPQADLRGSGAVESSIGIPILVERGPDLSRREIGEEAVEGVHRVTVHAPTAVACHVGAQSRLRVRE